jgi:hypothetical protein
VVLALPVLTVGVAAPAAASALPTVSLVATPQLAEVGQSVQLAATAATDPGASIQEYDWDLGDGNTCTACPASMPYTYSSPGTYQVSVTVYDSNFSSASAAVSVRITPAPQETAQAGGILAELFYDVGQDQYGGTIVRNEHVRISSSGTVLADMAVDPRAAPAATCSGCQAIPFGYDTGDPSLFVKDLNGDGKPEVLLNLTSGGNICCRYTIVYGRTAQGMYRGTLITWIDQGAIPPLRDLRDDGSLQYVSSDGRFRYRFGCGACTPYPIQIWSLRNGQFIDVTRGFPRLVMSDAAWLYRRLRQAARTSGGDKEWVRGALAAYVADECSLRRPNAGWRVFDLAAHAGWLTDVNSTLPYPVSRFRRDLRNFLRRLRYLR